MVVIFSLKYIEDKVEDEIQGQGLIKSKGVILSSEIGFQ